MTTEHYVPLDRKYRPTSFADMVGQKELKDTFVAALRSKRIAAAYGLFGTTSAGKTTSTRILQKALTCRAPTDEGEACGECASCLAFVKGNHSDIIEVNASADRGIDFMRSLTSRIKMRPMVGARRVITFDEAHKITKDAWNAMLKVLEEPPEHVVFLISTTDPQMIPPTIINRLQVVKLKATTPAQCLKRLNVVAEAEKMADDGVTSDHLERIATATKGVLRTSLIALDKLHMLAINNAIEKGDDVALDDSVVSSLINDVTGSDAEKEASRVMRALLAYSGKANLAHAALSPTRDERMDQNELLRHLLNLSETVVLYSFDNMRKDIDRSLCVKVKDGAETPFGFLKVEDIAKPLALLVHTEILSISNKVSATYSDAGVYTFALISKLLIMVEASRKGKATVSLTAAAEGGINVNLGVMSALDESNHTTKIPE